MLTTEDYIAKENKPVKYWQNAVWPDETKAELFGCHNTHHVWRSKGTAYHPKNTILTAKFYIIKGRINGKMYRDLFDKILPEQFMWLVSRYEIFNKSQFKHVQYFYFSLCYFFNYYTILCLFLILILPTVHAVLWGFYVMLHRLGYHWGPTCYFTLSTWCVSTVQVSCTRILMKQWQFKPQEV